MEAKKKAVELARKMYYTHGLVDSDTAKQCALIVVEEIIEQLEFLHNTDRYYNGFEFWVEVKEEIKNL